jgi:hypothetical protein
MILTLTKMVGAMILFDHDFDINENGKRKIPAGNGVRGSRLLWKAVLLK